MVEETKNVRQCCCLVSFSVLEGLLQVNTRLAVAQVVDVERISINAATVSNYFRVTHFILVHHRHNFNSTFGRLFSSI